jgi:hypothetical protein
MSMAPGRPSDWPQALRRYLGVSLTAHLLWEVVQLPLYTIWTTGTGKQQVFAVLHCTAGDAMIAGLSLLVALAVSARRTWPSAGVLRVYLASLTIGVLFTIYSEWLNTSVRGSWAYSGRMPVVPVIGTGLTPLLQWFVIPTVALWIAIGRAPWINEESKPRNV